MGRDIYVRRLLPTALSVWRSNERLRTEAASQLEIVNSREVQESEAFLETVADPLETSRVRNEGGVLLSDEFALDQLSSPPYKVIFPNTEAPATYLNDPFHIPYFKVVPRYDNVLAIGTHGRQQGRRRRFGKEDLPSWTQDALEERRTQMGIYLRALVKPYLADFGFNSLEQKHKNIVADINRHSLSPREVQRKRRIQSSTYYAYLHVLKRRGWDWQWHIEKKREVLRYNPVLDRCKSFYSSVLLDIEGIDIGAVLSLAGAAIEAQLYESEPSDEAIQRELRTVRKDLRRASSDLTSEAEYDRRLRAFITDLVERPIHSEQRFCDIEDRFRMLPFRRRLGLFCAAVRTKQSIVDVMDLAATFADVIYEHRELEELVGVVSLSDLLEKSA